MKTLNLLLFTLSLLFVNSVIAQEECGTDEILGGIYFIYTILNQSWLA